MLRPELSLFWPLCRGLGNGRRQPDPQGGSRLRGLGRLSCRPPRHPSRQKPADRLRPRWRQCRRGAVLHLLRDAYAPDMDDEALGAIAAKTGADGVMCLWARSSLAEGYGERLTPVSLPSVAAVLINPGVACATAEVYRRFDAQGQFSRLDAMAEDIVNVEVLTQFLAKTRNKPAGAGRGHAAGDRRGTREPGG